MSGKQLFTIDTFRDTGKPLLAVLTESNSIFMVGLRRFKRHALYCNVVNDRVADYYTTSISKTDPFRENLNKIKVNYIDGGEDVIVDYNNPVDVDGKPEAPKSRSWGESIMKYVKAVPLVFAIAFFVPLGVVIYMVNAVIQSFRSASRIRLHEAGKGGVKIENYRMPFMLEIQGEVDHALEALNTSQSQQYLRDGDVEQGRNDEERQILARERRMSVAGQPTLALAPCQFDMIDSLNSLKWRKYPVWIHKHRHSHAAIIVRSDKKEFDEGRLVLKHFAEQEFLK
jgi:hypothetical protein